MKKNTTKCTAFFMSILFYSFALGAQNKQIKVSAELGLTRSILNSDVSNLKNTKFEVNSGVMTGFNVEYNFFNNFVVATGLSFIQKNHEYKKTDNATITNTSYKNNFINIPLNIGYYLITNPYNDKGFWLKISGGVFYERFISMNREGNYPTFFQAQGNGKYIMTHADEKYDFKTNEKHLKRNLWGIEAEGSVGYSFNSFDIFASYTYQHGLTGVYKTKSSSNIKEIFKSSIISLGCAYKF